LDSQGQVWEIATGKIKVAPPWSVNAYLTPSGSEIVALMRLPPRWDPCLAHYDVQTGQEMAERRMRLRLGEGAWGLRCATSDGRLMLVNGAAVEPPGSEIMKFLSWLMGARRAEKPPPRDVFFLVEPATGRILAEGRGQGMYCTPDGHYLLTRTKDNKYQLWDVPPRKSLFWFFTWSLVWSGSLALIVVALHGRRGRKQDLPSFCSSADCDERPVRRRSG
jgi:hypothetical protein